MKTFITFLFTHFPGSQANPHPTTSPGSQISADFELQLGNIAMEAPASSVQREAGASEKWFPSWSLGTRLTSLLIVLFCCASITALITPHQVQAAPVQVEILFMNHGPMQPTIRNIKKVLSEFEGNITTQWFDANMDSGHDFMKDKKIKGHVPMLILINNEKSFQVNGSDVTFQGFPTGGSPFKSVEGNWAIKDLQQVLTDKTK